MNDSHAFRLAKSVKLGRDTSSRRMPDIKSSYSSSLPSKEKYECVKDADCAGTLVCRSNKCIDPCTGVACPGGQKCSVGKCVSCSRGESCGCSSLNVSNGSGACFDPCNPNRCTSTTPSCSRSGANYSCACTSTSCGAGKKCSGSSCTNCSANESCNCPSGQKANGSGGCATVACSGNSDCGAGKQCANAGTTSAYCYNCSANTQCTCPSGQLSNGSGGCVRPVCTDNTTCGAGRQCIDPGKYNAACDPCPSGSQCTCPSGQVADGTGGCREQKGCPLLCPERIITYSDGSKGGRRCGGLLHIQGDKIIGPEAVYVPETFSSGVHLSGPATVLENGRIQSSNISGNVIIGGPDCDTPIGSPFVYRSAVIGNNIRVYGDTTIENCTVGGNAQISGGRIFGSRGINPGEAFRTDCNIFDNAFIGGDVYLKYNTVKDQAAIYGKATVVGSTISGNARIYGEATVYDATVTGDAKVCDGVSISGMTLSACDKRYCSDCP